MPDIDAMWDFADATASEATFRAALDGAPQDAQGFRLELGTQIARALGLQNRFDEAHATLDEIEPAVGEDQPRAKLRYLLERGRVFNSSKRIDEARGLFSSAWQLGRKVGEDRLAIDAAHMLAIVEGQDPDLALEWNLKALDYTEKSHQSDAKKWLGSLYNNIGWTYFDKQDNARALQLFEKALGWREGQDDTRATLIARWSVARVLRALGRVGEALEIQRDLETAYADGDLGEDGFVHEELAECLLALGRPGHAAHFGKAHGLLSKQAWLVESEPERVERLRRLSVAAE